MAIHIPISLKAQAEAKTLMLSSNNCTLPSSGQPNLLLNQDMILGCYSLTVENNCLNYLFKKIMRIKIFKNLQIHKLNKNNNNNILLELNLISVIF